MVTCTNLFTSEWLHHVCLCLVCLCCFFSRLFACLVVLWYICILCVKYLSMNNPNGRLKSVIQSICTLICNLFFPLTWQVHWDPSSKYLKQLCLSLKLSKPPPNITSEMLFTKLESQIRGAINESKHGIGTPLLKSELSEQQWVRNYAFMYKIRHHVVKYWAIVTEVVSCFLSLFHVEILCHSCCFKSQMLKITSLCNFAFSLRHWKFLCVFHVMYQRLYYGDFVITPPIRQNWQKSMKGWGMNTLWDVKCFWRG